MLWKFFSSGANLLVARLHRARPRLTPTCRSFASLQGGEGALDPGQVRAEAFPGGAAPVRRTSGAAAASGGGGG